MRNDLKTKILQFIKEGYNSYTQTEKEILNDIASIANNLANLNKEDIFCLKQMSNKGYADKLKVHNSTITELEDINYELEVKIDEQQDEIRDLENKISDLESVED